MSQRCPCGCDRSFKTTDPRQKYLSPLHRYKAARDRYARTVEVFDPDRPNEPGKRADSHAGDS